MPTSPHIPAPTDTRRWFRPGQVQFSGAELAAMPTICMDWTGTPAEGVIKALPRDFRGRVCLHPFGCSEESLDLLCLARQP